ncbi:GntR family transcriptional regulator [Novosphingobium resinovorum]|uniref:GntR family transcriptional regulator n=1 Tax=Novosphingobium resinovorum TaxID=158500 RepID=A0A031JQQ4_9SPHN|nr:MULTISPECIES: GntR family transcriptional regulator [Sphingomonadaceae]AOR80083.1 hypothetical protein BES08_21195 [Novosphingobium resinovorum]EJU12884.1 GntR family transcriptional regulator [Sphingomonas sp. LH128]EZP76593.1 GntR family transcriptional regulator [Novosphingobium resinovorum]MBF7013944.1 GntR family transcriptional regulator [Novosphingobium sp. HR1a]WJM26088.1 GntR family transcriptional regulator [Novosphingobium resinovorum]
MTAFLPEDAEKGSNAEEAYAEVLGRLRLGLIAPGDRIVDKALAAELGMSRMPAREALLRLVHEGYLVGSTRGFRLPTPSNADILEIFEIRKMLEPRAAAMAVVEMTPESLATLEAAFADAQKAYEKDDMMALFNANVAFREAWLAVVPNVRLVAMIHRHFDQVNAVRLATLHDKETRAISVTIASTLLAGFRRRDSLYVYEQMLSFIENARLRFVALNPFDELGLGSEDK